VSGGVERLPLQIVTGWEPPTTGEQSQRYLTYVTQTSPLALVLLAPPSV
jgi:hypothetical protein